MDALCGCSRPVLRLVFSLLFPHHEVYDPLVFNNGKSMGKKHHRRQHNCSVFLFPPLYGEGYGFIDKLLSGDGGDFTHFSLFASDGAQTMTPILMAAGILAVKAFATSSTNSGGGVAGDFAPTLFAGAVAGFLFAATFNTVFMSGLPIGIFVFLGMAAVMAGAIQAPLMAVFLTAEMASGGSVLLLPLALCAMLSYLTVRVLHIFFHHRFRWTRS